MYNLLKTFIFTANKYPSQIWFFTLLDFFLTENVLFLLVLWFSEADAVAITEQLVRTCSGRICEVLLSPLCTQRDIIGPNSESCCG